jgi:hypothetical protein
LRRKARSHGTGEWRARRVVTEVGTFADPSHRMLASVSAESNEVETVGRQSVRTVDFCAGKSAANPTEDVNMGRETWRVEVKFEFGTHGLPRCGL